MNIQQKETRRFLQEFDAAFKADRSILSAFEALSKNPPSEAYAEFYADEIRKIHEEGSRTDLDHPEWLFSELPEKFQSLFPEHVFAMLSDGERGGALDTRVAELLAEYPEA